MRKERITLRITMMKTRRMRWDSPLCITSCNKSNKSHHPSSSNRLKSRRKTTMMTSVSMKMMKMREMIRIKAKKKISLRNTTITWATMMTMTSLSKEVASSILRSRKLIRKCRLLHQLLLLLQYKRSQKQKWLKSRRQMRTTTMKTLKMMNSMTLLKRKFRMFMRKRKKRSRLHWWNSNNRLLM